MISQLNFSGLVSHDTSRRDSRDRLPAGGPYLQMETRMKQRCANTRRGKPPGGSQRGFTLIELLIVMIIIGLLGALVAPQAFPEGGHIQTAGGKSSDRHARYRPRRLSARYRVLSHDRRGTGGIAQKPRQGYLGWSLPPQGGPCRSVEASLYLPESGGTRRLRPVFPGGGRPDRRGGREWRREQLGIAPRIPQLLLDIQGEK